MNGCDILTAFWSMSVYIDGIQWRIWLLTIEETLLFQVKKLFLICLKRCCFNFKNCIFVAALWTFSIGCFEFLLQFARLMIPPPKNCSRSQASSGKVLGLMQGSACVGWKLGCGARMRWEDLMFFYYRKNMYCMQRQRLWKVFFWNFPSLAPPFREKQVLHLKKAGLVQLSQVESMESMFLQI